MSESQLIEYKESWRAYGIAEPEYTVHPNDIMMMFKANDPINDPINLFDLIKPDTGKL